MEHVMTVYYVLKVRVPLTKLATILELLNEEGEVDEITIDRQRTVSPGPRKPRGGPTSEDRVVEALRFKPCNKEGLAKMLASYGFAASTVTPTLSALNTARKIYRDVEGFWHIIDTK
jgi:hypothetical protein